MDKLAFVKVAEVSGVVASLLEHDMLKLASAEDFDAVVDAVAGDLPDSYDLDAVLNKTAEVMEFLGAQGQEDEGVEKEAGDLSQDELLQYVGALTMAKEAGDISEEEFAKEAGAVGEALGKLKGAGAYLGGGLTGKKLRQTAQGNKTFKNLLNSAKGQVDAKATAAFGKGKSKVKAEYINAHTKGIADKLKAAGVTKGSAAPGIKQLLAGYGAAGAAGAAGVAGYKGLKKNQDA